MDVMRKKLRSNLIIKGRHQAYWLDEFGLVLRSDRVENVVVYEGIETMFKKMANEYGGSLAINKAALGSGTNTAVVGDTQLQSETYRNDVISATAGNNVIYVDAFFTQTEVTGTFREFGFFIDGGTTSSSGYLWNRTNVNWTKSSVESLFIRSTFTITNA